MTEWRSIVGFEGYQVSETGDFRRVRFIKKIDGWATQPLKKTMRHAAYINMSVGGKVFTRPWVKVWSEVWEEGVYDVERTAIENERSGDRIYARRVFLPPAITHGATTILFSRRNLD